MVTIRRVNASVLDSQVRPERPLSPREMARQKREAKLRGMVNQMGTPSDVFEVIPEDEKPITLRLSLRKVAAELGVEVAIRKHGNGFLVGLMTPERRSNRGRRPVTAE